MGFEGYRQGCGAEIGPESSLYVTMEESETLRAAI